MLKITKSTKTISFAWEKDDEPGFFEQLQENNEFRNVISKYIDAIPVTITSTKVIIKICDIKDKDKNIVSSTIKAIEAIINDFFNIFLYPKYNIYNKAGLSPDFSKITEYSLSIALNDTYEVDSCNLFIDNDGYLFYKKDAEYHPAAFINPLSNKIILSSKYVESINKDLIRAIKDKEYTSAIELLESLDLKDEKPICDESKLDNKIDLCRHWNNGRITLTNDADNNMTCTSCHETFKMKDYQNKEVEDISKNAIDLLQNINIFYLDMPEDIQVFINSGIKLLKKTPELYRIACDNFKKYEETKVNTIPLQIPGFPLAEASIQYTNDFRMPFWNINK